MFRVVDRVMWMVCRVVDRVNLVDGRVFRVIDRVVQGDL